MTLKLTAASMAVLTLALVGCERAPTSEPTPAAPTPVSSSPVTATPDPAQAWLGRWNGPEGTYLQVASSGGGRYELRIKDLDAERTFQATSKDGGLQFERDGKAESIRATDGDATGMKWLAGKSTCLTVHVGEGYCRD